MRQVTHKRGVVALFCLLLTLALSGTTSLADKGESTSTESQETRRTLSKTDIESGYPWSGEISDWPESTILRDRFTPPSGYERVDVGDGSFGEFLRELPVRLDRTSVHSYDGRRLNSPSAGVVVLPVGDKNLQQCADTLIRLRSEYLWLMNRKAEISFHFTSGDQSTWKNWRDGEYFQINGNEVHRRDGTARGGSRDVFLGYLEHLFRYAGTRSLKHDSTEVQPDEKLEPGDFFVDPGSPGHAVMILDIAESSDGTRIALLGQGFMPAQEFHVLEAQGRPDVIDDIWFELPSDGGQLDTPSWSAFKRSDARRFGN